VRTPRLLVIDQADELRDQVQRVTASLHPRPSVVSWDHIEAEVDAGTDRGAFDVVVAGPRVTAGDGLQQLRRLRERAPGTRLILAVDRWRSTSLRDTVRTGALDILRLPVDDGELLEALEQALEMGPGERPGADEPGPPSGHGTVVAVMSATGGCGKTFFATNLAYHLQSRARKRTCLIDLDLQFGELSTALRLKPKYTVRDLVSHDVDRGELVRRLEEHLVDHDSGIRLLAAPDEPADADSIDPADVARVIDAARSRFDFVVLDTPPALGEPVLAALDYVDLVFALATLDLPSVRNLGLLLTTLRRLKVPAEAVRLLLNKVEADVGIDMARVAEYFPQGFSMAIPYGRDVNRSLNMGQPVLAFAPGGEVSRSLEAGLDLVLGLQPGAGSSDDAPAPAASWWARRAVRRQRKIA
jgi:pilus assembly protein CpaE